VGGCVATTSNIPIVSKPALSRMGREGDADFAAFCARKAANSLCQQRTPQMLSPATLTSISMHYKISLTSLGVWNDAA